MMDFVDPFLAYRPGGLPAFTPDDRPLNVGQINFSDRADQGLE